MLVYGSVKEVKPSEIKKGDVLIVNVTDSLFVRTGPGTNYEIAGKLNPSEEVTLEDTKLYNDNWYKIKSKSGLTGYCHKDYLTFKSVIENKSLINIKASDFAAEMVQWHKASGNCIAGLLYRRIDEIEVFLYAEYTRDGSKNKHKFPLPSCCS